MNVTIFPTGTGSSKSAVNYLLSDTDHEGKKRSEQPEIIFGDPNTFIAIADSTYRKHKYTSGAISFRDNEAITDRQIDEVIKNFRSTFLPGLQADKNYADFWVAHRDKGNLELHFLVANTELSGSQQQLNIHPPGEKNIQFFNTFVSVCNHTLGFAQVVPDPLKPSLKPFEAKSPNGKSDKKAKSDLASRIHTDILADKIKNRNQLIGFLTKNDVEVCKVGSDFITVRLAGAKKNTRLKGPLFTKGSDYKELVKQHHLSKVPQYLTPQEAQSQQQKLADHIRARSDFNHKRYLTPKPGAKRANKSKHAPRTTQSRISKNIAAVRQSAITPPPDTASISAKLQARLDVLKPDAEEKLKPPVPVVKQQLSSRINAVNQRTSRASPSQIVELSSALDSLEGQIGDLSIKRHILLINIVDAKGLRYAMILSQIMLIEQKLAALNEELQKKKANLDAEKKLGF